MDDLAKDAAVAVNDIEGSVKALFKEAEGRSVNSLLARHSRERLFVPPLLWDHRQPALLQCRFLPRKRPAPPLPPAPPMPEEMWEPADPIEEIDDVARLHARADPWAAFSLLDGRYPGNEGCGFSGGAAMFCYGQRPLCHVGYAVTIGPGIVLLTKPLIKSYRNGLIKRYFPGARQNHRIYSIAYRRFLPPKSMPDPYIAAVLIALAQARRRVQEEWDELEDEDEEDEEEEEGEEQGQKEEIEAHQNDPKRDDDIEAVQIKQLNPDTGGEERTKSAEQTFPVVVIVHKGDHLSIFAANVTAAFLAKLDEPGKPPPQDAYMDIHQQRVMFDPYETFAGRFAGAVLDIRHQHGPGGQDAGESSSKREGKGDSFLLCIRQRTSSVDGGGNDTNGSGEPGETGVKRKQCSGADWCKADPKENRVCFGAKRRRKENESV